MRRGPVQWSALLQAARGPRHLTGAGGPRAPHWPAVRSYSTDWTSTPGPTTHATKARIILSAVSTTETPSGRWDSSTYAASIAVALDCATAPTSANCGAEVVLMASADIASPAVFAHPPSTTETPTVTMAELIPAPMRPRKKPTNVD